MVAGIGKSRNAIRATSVAALVLSSLALSACATSPIGLDGPTRGIASWYGPRHHGKKTASGETFDMNQMTAAHRTLPFGSWIRVRNLSNSKEVRVRINDRGPFSGGRIIDLSRAAAKKLDMLATGEAKVELYVERAARAGN